MALIRKNLIHIRTRKERRACKYHMNEEIKKYVKVKNAYFMSDIVPEIASSLSLLKID